jgi:DNA-binding NtrC family response regulator
MRSSETPWKFVLLGGDRKTAADYMSAAALEGHHLDYFASMHEIGYLGRFREYDAAIVHGDMHPLSGLELAEYLEKLFQSLPMILLTSADDHDTDGQMVPASVADCYPASEEARRVLGRAVEVLQQPRKRFTRMSMVLEPG